MSQQNQDQPTHHQQLLREATGAVARLAKEGGAATASLKVIAPGWGTSGYYSEAMLRRDGPQAFRAGTHMYADHPTRAEERDRPERSIKDLAGVLISDAKYQDGPQGPGLYAEASVLPQWKPFIAAAADHIGVSIRAMGEAVEGEAEGRRGMLIDRLTEGVSVDFVTRAGAGGKVLSLYESARQIEDKPDKEDRLMADQAQQLTESMQKLSEAQTALAEARREASEAQSKLATLTKDNEALRESLTTLTEAVATQAANAITDKVIAESKLPEAAQKRVRTMIENYSRPMADGKLNLQEWQNKVEGAVKEESEYLASIGKPVTGMGSKTGAPDAGDLTKRAIAAFEALGYSTEQAKIMAEGRGGTN